MSLHAGPSLSNSREVNTRGKTKVLMSIGKTLIDPSSNSCFIILGCTMQIRSRRFNRAIAPGRGAIVMGPLGGTNPCSINGLEVPL